MRASALIVLRLNRMRVGRQGLKTINIKGEIDMKYVCSLCGFEYDEEKGYPEGGIAPGTPWDELPEDFECPLCGVGREMFEQE